MRVQPLILVAILMAAEPVAAQRVAKGQAPVLLDPVTVRGQPLPIPRLRRNPAYPMQARHRWEEGCVVMRFTIRPDGKTDDFAILESQPRGVFERSVIEAVFRWEYDPAPHARSVIEVFEFRSSALSAHPRYTVRHATPVAVASDGMGNRRYELEMQLQGYSPPDCARKR